MKLAVFDCDGTLSDGQHAVVAAMERAFEAAGLPPPDRSAVRRIVGLSLPAAIARLAPDEEPEVHAFAVGQYKHAFREARERGEVIEPLFDGVAELLARLHAGGWTLGVATGKSDRGLALTIASHGLAPLFTTLQTADRHPSKPNPSMLIAAMAEAGAEPGETVVIGDTVYDVEMARAAGVRALGVAWGYHAPDELLAAGARAVAASATELEDLLDG